MARSLAVPAAAVALAACHDATATGPAAPRPALFVDPDTARMHVGETYRLQIRTRNQVSLRDLVIWVQSGDAVTVDNIGVVRALRPGIAVVQVNATADGEDATAQARIAVVGIVVEPWYSPPYGVGTRVPLVWRVYSATGGGGDQRVTWRSSAPAVAAVSELGVIEARGVGTATLTAVALSDTTIRATFPVEVR
jgi:uncharacterized protein YjdB